MNRAAVARSVIAVLLALVACSSKRSANPAENGNGGAAQAAQTTDKLSGDLAGQGATPASQTDTQEVKSDDLEAEIISRDGTVTRGDPSRADWSETSLFCFPDCKGAPHDSPETDLIVLKDGAAQVGQSNSDCGAFLQHP